MSKSKLQVAFQGEIGAYSEEAALALYPAAEARPFPSFEAVFEAVEMGAVSRAVLPIENSLFGSVHQNYDLLREHNLRIVGEVQLRIKHQLLSLKGSRIDLITHVFSHPQALGQCKRFIKESLPNAEIVPSYDTAGAAKKISEMGQKTHAAIASRAAAVEYGLITLAADIESNQENYTRFLALSRHELDSPERGESLSTPNSGNAEVEIKTSLLYAQKENLPGGLFKSLAVFALRGIDLYKIESRPLVGSPGKYIFYLDLKGHQDDEKVKNALHHLREIAAFVKVLGSYESGRFIS